MVGATALFVLLMLLADGAEIASQLAVASATGIFLWLLVRTSSVSGAQVVCAMVIATAGELVLSLGWGLYSYRFAAIPFYVPIGHGLFYTLAVESARQERLRQRQAPIVGLVLLGGTLYALVSATVAGDAWGLLWWIGAALLITRSRSPLLMSTCVVYTILLEWAGTAIGNWRWADVVPAVGLRSANPPSGVGILYCLLDLLTVLVCSSAWFARLERGVTPSGRPVLGDGAEEGLAEVGQLALADAVDAAHL